MSRLEPKLFALLSVFILSTFYFLPTTAHASGVMATPDNTGLVGYWSLDASTINWATGVVRDLSGKGNNGHVVHMSTTTSPVQGILNQALSFNGTNSIISSFSHLISATGSSRTVCAWLNTPNPSSREGLVSTRDLGAGTGFVLTVGISAAGNLSYYHTGGSVLTIAAGIKANKWYLACVTYDASALVATLYLNGKNIGSQGSFAADSNTSSNGIIGDEKSNGSNPFSGSIDEVRIYNRALSAAQVATLYNDTKAAHVDTSNTTSLTSGLVGYWPLDGSTINWATGIVRDLSGQNNTGSLINMSTSTSPVQGKIGGALKFNGSSNYISTQVAASNLVSSSTGSISVWINPTGASPSSSSAYGTEEIISDTSDNFGLFRGTVGGLDRVWVQNYSLLGGSETKVGVTYTNNKWIHVIWVHSGGVLYAYANGVFISSTAANDSAFASNRLRIGYGGGAATYFQGSIDDVRIYNRALSAGEVKQLYAAGAANINHSNTVALSSGLVGYWTFDGGSLNWKTGTAADSSGNNNTGQLIKMSTSTSPVEGKIGQALKFNGVNSYVDAGNPTSLQITGPMTMSLWFNVNTFPGTSADFTLLSKGYNGTSVPYFFDIANSSGVNNLRTGTFSGGGNYIATYPVAGNIVTKTWYHAVGTWNGSVWQLYLNGVLVNTAISNHAPFSNSNSVYIGGFDANGTLARVPNGKIDDVRIYNRALSATEVRQLYLLGK